MQKPIEEYNEWIKNNDSIVKTMTITNIEIESMCNDLGFIRNMCEFSLDPYPPDITIIRQNIERLRNANNRVTLLFEKMMGTMEQYKK